MNFIKNIFKFSNGYIFNSYTSITFSIYSAQESDVKLPITVKEKLGDISTEEVSAKPIALTTVQKLFNIKASDFNNVTANLKNDNVGAGQTNKVVLNANNGFVF